MVGRIEREREKKKKEGRASERERFEGSDLPQIARSLSRIKHWAIACVCSRQRHARSPRKSEGAVEKAASSCYLSSREQVREGRRVCVSLWGQRIRR